MLTPIDIQNHKLKSTMGGYNKKDTDDFLASIIESFEILYKENQDLKDKIASLSEGVQYYKQMEGTLQKALVLAEKTSNETQEAAKSQADSLLRDANSQAEILKSKANQELEETRNHVRKLVQSYENYRLQFKKLAESQIEMLDSEAFAIYAPELDELMDNAPGAGADIKPVSKQAIVIDNAAPKAAAPKKQAPPSPQPQAASVMQSPPPQQDKSTVIEFISPDEDVQPAPQKAAKSPFVTPDEPKAPAPQKKETQSFVSPFIDDGNNDAFVSPFVDDEPSNQASQAQPQAAPQPKPKAAPEEFLSPFVDDEPQSSSASPFTFIDPE